MKTDILFLAHGGGPMPLLDHPEHREMVSCLASIAREIPRPDAILVISAHWEESVPVVTAGSNPELIYDYYGFPPESYDITYPSPGKPALAHQVYQALEHAGVPARMDEQRGFDHGMFVPLILMYPEADVPVVQLSLVDNLDAGLHLRIGKALQSLSESASPERLLVVGSGFSFHNMKAFFSDDPESTVKNLAFEQWLQQTCTDSGLAESERYQRLEHWASAPGARYCHPREEHLLPLHICYGMASRAADQYWSLEILGKQASMFFWEGS
jgi:aromatic ring-opening dioxygenase catalytic subunit (LigB family)